MSSGKENVVLYHDKCPDGFAAYYVAKKALGDVVGIPVQHGDPVPAEAKDPSAKVFILDFSYPREVLEDLKASCAKLVVLDHHITAQEALAGLDFAHFEQSKSGCVLAWEYFFPGQECPELLLYIQDRDLWKWELPHSREVSAATRTYGLSDESFDQLWNKPIPELAKEGGVVLKTIDDIAGAIAEKAINIQFDGKTAAIVNSSIFQSEIGEKLCAKEGVDFAVIYFDILAQGKRIYSLRSRAEGYNVGDLAKRYGGGGHKTASSFSVPISAEEDPRHVFISK